ncbi:penicillin-binding protein [Candidatus Phycosocius spiralis]|uniref:Penicillin-binding protein n=2 Tax=Candidatus Phycosocius spiralis TaxID=2815099 RepID=A0ABQ4PUC6_9PROT|nr:penicillin-binding protein [Candidatus Phycosocius spiralis]
MIGPAFGKSPIKNPLVGLDGKLDLARQQWRVPGLALGIVKDGMLIYAKGFGWADGAQTRMIHPDTLFGCASLTKAFTAASIALLVDEGKLDWDEPVTTYLPGFKVAGGLEYASLSLRDMLSHRTGLGSHDLVWYHNSLLTKADVMERMAYLPMLSPLRSSYHYTNLMYIVVGLVVERVTDQTWEDFIQARILKPLAMARTGFSPLSMVQDPDFAFGHTLDPLHLAKQIPLRPEDAIGPAGALYASVTQFSAWIALQLGRGVYQGQRLISQAQCDAMWEPLIPTGGQPDTPHFGRGFYGLGWRIDSYRGMRRVAHGGNLNGYSSRLTLFPDHHLGIIAFANLRGTPLPGHVSLDICDALLGLEPANWSENGLARRAIHEAKAASLVPPTPIPLTSPSRSLSAFTGTYHHHGYGLWQVEMDDLGLRATYNDMPVRLQHWHYDVFKAKPLREDDIDLAMIGFSFLSNMAGHIGELQVEMDADFPPIAFKRLS